MSPAAAATTETLRIALAQMNPVLGDLAANTDAKIEAMRRAEQAGCDIVVFGELSICGYPPEDLVLKARFVDDCWAQLQRLAGESGECAAVVGLPERGADGALYNSAAICRQGRVEYLYRKQELPTYQVFDEDRWFTPGPRNQPLWEVRGRQVGISVCEDVWIVDGPVIAQSAAGAELFININGSPYHRGKGGEREYMLAERARAAGGPIIYVNQIGGQDELIFDGGSLAIDATGQVAARLAQFREAFEIIEVIFPPAAPGTAPDGTAPDTMQPGAVARIGGVAGAPPTMAPVLDPLEEVWSALVLGTHDYLTKNGFSEVYIGLSGGVDSSIVAVIAADAIGAEHVHGVLMPSRFSSEGSVSDAVALCEAVGIDHVVIGIEPAHRAFEDMLAPSFVGREPDLTEENLQSRLRGVTLMALSNKFGAMVLTTGNKSESAVGYSTLYGDTAGGLAVIKDVYKLTVYELCRWRNAREGRQLIPEAVLTKAPSAELRPDQRDDQSLPPYEVLDPILEGYVDGDLTAQDLIERGHPADVVRRVCRLVDIAEYKRRQTPPGLRVSPKAFGRDRRLPMTNRYR